MSKSRMLVGWFGTLGSGAWSSGATARIALILVASPHHLATALKHSIIISAYVGEAAGRQASTLSNTIVLAAALCCHKARKSEARFSRSVSLEALSTRRRARAARHCVR